MFSYADVSMSKRERTRSAIRAVALASFRDRGYDATTIRLIAAEAGVSVGTTNYHFPSKNHLVQELYADVQDAHRLAATPALAAAGTDLTARMRIAFRTGLDGLAAYRPHAPEFLAAAVSPTSPLNPLSPDSAPALAVVEGIFRDAVEGAAGLPDDLRQALPRALVLAHLLLVLFWVYDRSPGQSRTTALLDRALALVRAGLPLARLPLVRRPLRELLALVGSVGA